MNRIISWEKHRCRPGEITRALIGLGLALLMTTGNMIAPASVRAARVGFQVADKVLLHGLMKKNL